MGYIFLLCLVLIIISHTRAFCHLKLSTMNRYGLSRSKFAFSSMSMEMESVESSGEKSESLMDKMKVGINIVYKFSRPHTIKGTILASLMGVTRALKENPNSMSWSLVPNALVGLIALLCGNAYIVGINQIYDVNVDKINKPFLPIAAGQMSLQQAWALVLGCLVAGGAAVRLRFSPLIFRLYCLGGILGTIYSAPPFSFKRFPLAAGGIIATVRGFLLNFGVYYAVREALGVSFQWNPVVIFISSFMTLFASVIAITKDLPDIEGDVKYNITTLASKYGVKAVSRLATGLLCAAYCTAMAIPFTPISRDWGFNWKPMLFGHMTVMIYLLQGFRSLDKAGYSLEAIKTFYFKSIWNVFYSEYALYALI
jgi:homogentisate solanesyltransferase